MDSQMSEFCDTVGKVAAKPQMMPLGAMGPATEDVWLSAAMGGAARFGTPGRWKGFVTWVPWRTVGAAVARVAGITTTREATSVAAKRPMVPVLKQREVGN